MRHDPDGRGGLRGAGRIAIGLAVAGTGLLGLTSWAQTPAAPPARYEVRESRECLRARDIRSTRIRSASVIDFHLRNGDVFRNDLGERCGGLDPRDAITYQRTSPNLCRGDAITVLDRPRLTPGASCPLNDFVALLAERPASARSAKASAKRTTATD